MLSATLALPASAASARPSAPRAAAATTLDAAVAVGQRYWGAVGCRGQIRVVAQRRPAAAADPATDAWVTFDSPLGANNLAAPAGSFTNCVISLAERRWPTTASMREDWDLLCTTMVHELGHLLGHAHDDTPGSVMAPFFTDVSGLLPLCRASRPALRAARARPPRPAAR